MAPALVRRKRGPRRYLLSGRFFYAILVASATIAYITSLCWGVAKSNEGLETIRMAQDMRPSFLALDGVQDRSSIRNNGDGHASTIKHWRSKLRGECQTIIDQAAAKSADQSEVSMGPFLREKERVELAAINSLLANDPTAQLHSKANGDAASSTAITMSVNAPEPCKHVFLDLGTNRGDSIGYFLDAVLDVCSPLWVTAFAMHKGAYRNDQSFPHPHFETETLTMHTHGFKSFGLLGLLQRHYGTIVADSTPEDVCVYGVEGNPHFTARLKRLQDFINHNIQPKPMKHLEILTETVVAPTDGITTLYVDQFSAEHHFWGSSLIQSMPDIRKTAKRNNGTSVKAHVTGISLSTMIRSKLGRYLKDNAGVHGSAAALSGASILVKMDVEGAEYSIVKEVAASNVLCDFVDGGRNSAMLVVEFHQDKIKDKEEKRQAIQGMKAAKVKLRECGVVFKQLPTYWTD